VPAPSHLEWGRWFETADRTVAHTEVGDDAEVSTVFLSLNHNIFGDGPPILFETLVFGGVCDGAINRYATWDEALDGHQEMVALVIASETVGKDLWEAGE
jgi:hypothetical protein